jgi:hypothetical protein
VYNTTRQIGGVLGSAGMAAFMTSRIGAEMPGGGERPPGAEAGITELPDVLQVPFSAALSQALLLPAFVALLGVVAALFLRGPGDRRPVRVQAPAGGRHVPDDADFFPDDDEYVEYTVDWDEPESAPLPAVASSPADPRTPPVDESVTTPLDVHVEHPLPAPADEWHGGPVEAWQHLFVDDEEQAAVTDVHPVPAPAADVTHNGHAQNGHAHNGSRVDGPLADVSDRFEVPARSSAGRHSRRDEEATTGEDAGTYGRHSMRFRD